MQMLQNHKFSCYNRIVRDDDRKHVTNHSGRQCKKRIIRREYTIINNKSLKCIWNYLWSICEHLQILKLLLSYINEKIYNQTNKYLTQLICNTCKNTGYLPPFELARPCRIDSIFEKHHRILYFRLYRVLHHRNCQTLARETNPETKVTMSQNTTVYIRLNHRSRDYSENIGGRNYAVYD